MEYTTSNVSPSMEETTIQPVCLNCTSNDSSISIVIDPAIIACFNTVRQASFVFFLTTFIVGVLGNSITIAAILSSRAQTKSAAICFMLNLAIADSLFLVSLPFHTHNTFTSTWIFGKVGCRILSPAYGLNLFATIFTTVLMSVDRYLVVRKPFESRRRTPRKALVVCVIIWIVSLILVTPMWLYARVNRRGTACGTFMPPKVEMWWKNILLFVGLILPTVIMCCCYGRLLRQLFGKQSPSDNVSRPSSNVRKVTVMVMAVTVTFVLCWLPWHVLHYLPKSYIKMDLCGFIGLNVAAQILVFVSSCCNPFIYWISSRNFREMYSEVFRRCHPRTTITRNNGSTNINNTSATRVYGYKRHQPSCPESSLQIQHKPIGLSEESQI